MPHVWPHAKETIRFRDEYKNPQSDSVQMRENVRQYCNGVDSRAFHFRVQEQTRSIIQQPDMGLAINQATEKLYRAGRITGEEVEAIFEGHNVPTSPAMIEWVQ